jgi:hypothetical protein
MQSCKQILLLVVGKLSALNLSRYSVREWAPMAAGARPGERAAGVWIAIAPRLIREWTMVIETECARLTGSEQPLKLVAHAHG